MHSQQINQPLLRHYNPSKRSKFNGSILPESITIAKNIETSDEAYKIAKKNKAEVYGLTGNFMVVKFTKGSPEHFN